MTVLLLISFVVCDLCCKGLFLSHLFIPSYEKVWCFQELTRLSLRLNHFCISDFKNKF